MIKNIIFDIGNVIDGIFKCTRYGVWEIAVLGILASALMIFVNIGLGFGSVMISVALLLVSIAVTMLLMPKAIFKNLQIIMYNFINSQNKFNDLTYYNYFINKTL